MSQFENGEIFAADGDLLKITSMSKAPYNILDGKCQLIKISGNTYSWVLSKDGTKERKFTFIVSKDSDIKCSVRDGKFTITYRNKKKSGNNTTQLIGELKDKTLGTVLQQKIDEIKRSNLNVYHKNSRLNETSTATQTGMNFTSPTCSENYISSSIQHISNKRKCFTDQISQQDEANTAFNLMGKEGNQKCNDQIFGELIVSSLYNLPESDTKEELKISIQQLILQAKRNYNNDTTDHQATLLY